MKIELFSQTIKKVLFPTIRQSIEGVTKLSKRVVELGNETRDE